MCILEAAKDGSPKIDPCLLSVHRILSSAQEPPCMNASAGALGWGLRSVLMKLRMVLHIFLSVSDIC